MFLDIEDFNQRVAGQEIEVAGIGVSNIPLIHFLLERGALVTAHDQKDRKKLGAVAEELEKRGVRLKLGKDYLKELKGAYLFKSPGIRFDLPPILNYVKQGGMLTSEMEVFFQLCPAPIIGVTGSDGKTTTTTLIACLLERAGYLVHLGGNIGRPLLCDVEKIKENHWAVVELSSFQLHTMKHSPHIGVLTNITPNHLDMHKSMAEYIEAKKHLSDFQKKEDVLIANYDNDLSRSIGENAGGQVKFFSRETPLNQGASFQDGKILLQGKTVLSREDIRLPGLHNVENYMAAILAVEHLISPEVLKTVAHEFQGVAHRIEFIRELNGVKYYNDSIASSPSRTIACLNAFYEDGKKIILIAGGYDKKIPLEALGAEIAQKTKRAYLVGDTAEKMAQSILEKESDFPVFLPSNLQEALEAIKSIASAGDVVVLSPACASFDRYDNFEQRGMAFKKLVKEL